MLEAAPVKTGELGEAELDDGAKLEEEGEIAVEEAIPEDEAPGADAGTEEEDTAEVTSERLWWVGEAPSTGGMEMGWPAAEHWEMTMLETAVFIVSRCVHDDRC